MNSTAADKPLDVGSGRVCATFDLRSAAWLSVGMPHPIHGFVELSALPGFDERARGDVDRTRAHRMAMTLTEHAFLRVEIGGRLPSLAPDPSDPARPRWSGAGVEVVSEAPSDGEMVRQTWTLSAPAHAAGVAAVVGGMLDRPALAEITEVNPPPPTGATTSFTSVDGSTLVIEASALSARLELRIDGASVTWERAGEDLVAVLLAAPSPLTFTVQVRSGSRRGDANVHPRRYGDGPVDRALAYTRGCTTLRTADDERAILTDHRILPLSWTRDAYWQALALLAADEPGDRERVADHLRWLWRRCERPDGRWVRSHHANGRRKDLAFQADQQLYPIIELTDYWRLVGRLPDGVDWSGEVSRAWEAALDERDSRTGLMGSAENAADDPVAAPYLGGSQILLWYSAARLVELATAGVLDEDPNDLRSVAAAIQTSFATWFGRSGRPWPYAVDAAGARVEYHDANDLPVALAPMWGFCAADDAGWRATMTFAFSQQNPAFFVGERSGLGSVHTPAPWTLGDLQAWIVGRCIGDEAACAQALARLRSIAFLDGMLPEAYSVRRDPDVRIRHWFAWPCAALAALLILDRQAALERRLAAAPWHSIAE